MLLTEGYVGVLPPEDLTAARPTLATIGTNAPYAFVVTDASILRYTWDPAGEKLVGSPTTMTSLAGDVESLSMPNFLYGGANRDRDCIIILPGHRLNPQTSKGLDRDGGLYLQIWHHVLIVGGEFDMATDYVRRD